LWVIFTIRLTWLSKEVKSNEICCLFSVAINYGIFRRKDFNETAQNVMFYDMGAGSTAAAVVSFSTSKGRDPDPQATVLGVG
jgi:molecular chaperone DnaK (HSP70)